MRRVIEYRISKVSPDEPANGSVEHIKSVNRNTFWETSSKEGSLDLTFSETAIGEIDIGSR